MRSLVSGPCSPASPEEESQAQSCQGVSSHLIHWGVMGLGGGRGGIQPKSGQRRVCSSALRFSVKLFPFPSPLLYSGFFILLEGALLMVRHAQSIAIQWKDPWVLILDR